MPRERLSALAEALRPLRHPLLVVLWSATIVADIGWWVSSVATAWLSIAHDAGPVLVTTEYVVFPNQREPFLAALYLYLLSAQRRRDGAYAWGVFEDTAERDKFIETCLVESWLEYLRQHKRVTRADQMLERRLHSFLMGEPKTRHLVTPA